MEVAGSSRIAPRGRRTRDVCLITGCMDHKIRLFVEENWCDQIQAIRREISAETAVGAGFMPIRKVSEFSPLYLRLPVAFLARIRSQAGRRRFDPGRPLHLFSQHHARTRTLTV